LQFSYIEICDIAIFSKRFFIFLHKKSLFEKEKKHFGKKIGISKNNIICVEVATKALIIIIIGVCKYNVLNTKL